MQYNSHAKDTLIDQAKAEGKEVKTTTIKIWEIQRKPTQNGHMVITLVSDDKRKYSAFENIWDLQQLPVIDLEEGEELEVTYVKSDSGDYNNFLRVTRHANPRTEIYGHTISSSCETLEEDDGLPF